MESLDLQPDGAVTHDNELVAFARAVRIQRPTEARHLDVEPADPAGRIGPEDVGELLSMDRLPSLGDQNTEQQSRFAGRPLRSSTWQLDVEAAAYGYGQLLLAGIARESEPLRIGRCLSGAGASDRWARRDASHRTTVDKLRELKSFGRTTRLVDEAGHLVAVATMLMERDGQVDLRFDQPWPGAEPGRDVDRAAEVFDGVVVIAERPGEQAEWSCNRSPERGTHGDRNDPVGVGKEKITSVTALLVSACECSGFAMDDNVSSQC